VREDGPTDDPARVLALADLATPMALRVAATLRIADQVAGGARTAPALADAVHADADALDRVLRHLVTVGVLGSDGAGGYALTTVGGPLRSDHPHSVRARLDIDGPLGRADQSFVQLLHAVRTGRAGFPAQFGRTFWEDLSADAARTEAFDAMMGADVAAHAPAVVAALDWGTLGHVVDVGGGNGTLVVALLRAFPALHGTVLDLPGAARAAGVVLEEAGLSGRAGAVAGSFFDPLPPGADGYLLCEVLHNWDDAAATAILRRCAEAARPDGRVLVVERVPSDGDAVDTARGLLMLAYFGGRERDLGELTALAARAGLAPVAVHGAGAGSVIELAVTRNEALPGGNGGGHP